MSETRDLILPGQVRLRVKAPAELFEERSRLLLGGYLPGVEFAAPDAQPDFPVDQTIVFREACFERLLSLTSIVTLNGRWKGDSSILDMAHLIYSVARLEWMKSGNYPVHSACVGKLADEGDGGGYALLVGHSGAGKTAVASNLALHHGFKLFSGNKTLVRFTGDGKLQAIAGTRTMTSRSSGETAPKHVEYSGRTAYVLDDSMCAPLTPVEINAVLSLRLNEGYNESTRHVGDSQLHRMYPFFTDAVNADCILTGGTSVFSGAMEIGTGRRLATSLGAALREMQVYTLSGSLDYVTDSVKAILG